MTLHRPIRTALFGSGRIGQVHAANLAAHPDFELVVIADPFLDGALSLAEAHGAQAVATPEEAFDGFELDAVIIASPTSTHVDLILASARRGLAVMCEKPVDLDLTRARACREELQTLENARVMTGFNRRFDPQFAQIRARVGAGEIGSLEQLVIISRDPAPAPRGYLEGSGGIFRDMTIHDLDMARYFVPDIVSVSAQGSAQFSDDIRELGDYDTVSVTLRGASGQLVTIINSRHCAFGYDQRLEAFGGKGMLSAANVTNNLITASTAEHTSAGAPVLPFFLERYAAAYRAELDALAALTRGEGQVEGLPETPGMLDGVAALVLAEAAAESARTGATVNVAGAW